MIVATVFRHTVHTEIVGSLDADIGARETAAPASAGEKALDAPRKSRPKRRKRTGPEARG